ncbi:MAG TPA: transporter substrate-binding domain-containing protein, partial [Polyangia bacterium]|nr:transporter substrate-binding domain-containing protein [Polyangia bacterium]
MPAATRFVLATCALLAGCGAAREGGGALDRIRARGELTWGADEQGGEPYVFEDVSRGGALVGFEVDLADTLARALGVRARFVQNDWSTLVPSLERGTFDIALNGIEVTPALAARVAFSRPYY